MGVYLNLDGQELVLEAYGEVKLTPLNNFLARTEGDEKVLVRRFNERKFSYEKVVDKSLSFEGLSYDDQFLWDNVNESGEKLYCSELVYKLFYEFYGDFGTDGAIRAGYKEIIKLIKLDSKGMRKRIKELDSEDEENHY